MNLNKVLLIGNVTRDPEIRALPSGQQVANFGLATNRVWKKPDGTRGEAAEFHNIVTFGKLADIVKQYAGKGKMLMIEGRIQTRSWTAQDGSKKSRTEIVAETIQLGPKGFGGGAAQGSTNSPEHTPATQEELATVEYPDEELNPDDIPF